MKVLGAVSLVCFFRRRRKSQGARRREAVAVAVAVLIGYADCFEDGIASVKLFVMFAQKN